MTVSSARVAVVGAGILGTLTALRLGRAGYRVDLIDDRTDIWNGASVCGEGKIHLGYVYAKASDESIQLLQDSAECFDREIEAAVGRDLCWNSLVSKSFDYLVPPDSMISPEQFLRHSARVAGFGLDRYLGSEIDTLEPSLVSYKPTGVRFRTSERSVDITTLTKVVAESIRLCQRIRHVPEIRVIGVDRCRSGWRLVDRSGVLADQRYDVVVNCAWDGADALNRLALRADTSVPNLRLRAFVVGQSDGEPDAVTMVFGPFGDFVRFVNGRAYASWYPSGLLGFAETADVPSEWDALQRGPIEQPDLGASMIDALAVHIPAAASLRDGSVHARIVVASGSTDIDDPHSGLHERSDAYVTASEDGWVSVHSPKLTTGPMMASRGATAVEACLS